MVNSYNNNTTRETTCFVMTILWQLPFLSFIDALVAFTEVSTYQRSKVG